MKRSVTEAIVIGVVSAGLTVGALHLWTPRLELGPETRDELVQAFRAVRPSLAMLPSDCQTIPETPLMTCCMRDVCTVAEGEPEDGPAGHQTLPCTPICMTVQRCDCEGDTTSETCVQARESAKEEKCTCRTPEPQECLLIAAS